MTRTRTPTPTHGWALLIGLGILLGLAGCDGGPSLEQASTRSIASLESSRLAGDAMVSRTGSGGAALKNDASAEQDESRIEERRHYQLQFAEAEPHQHGVLAPLWRALDRSTTLFFESVGQVILVVVFLTPWLVLGIPALWLLSRLWRPVRRAFSRLGNRRRARQQPDEEH